MVHQLSPHYHSLASNYSRLFTYDLVDHVLLKLWRSWQFKAIKNRMIQWLWDLISFFRTQATLQRSWKPVSRIILSSSPVINGEFKVCRHRLLPQPRPDIPALHSNVQISTPSRSFRTPLWCFSLLRDLVGHHCVWILLVFIRISSRDRARQIFGWNSRKNSVIMQKTQGLTCE